MKRQLLFMSLVMALCLVGLRLANAGSQPVQPVQPVQIDRLQLVSESVPNPELNSPNWYRYYGRYYGGGYRYYGGYGYGGYNPYYGSYYGRYYGRYYGGYYPYYAYGWNHDHRTMDTLPQPRMEK